METENSEIELSELVDLDSMGEDEINDFARRLGHTPEENFKGDPGKYLPARDFLARALNELPLARSNLKRQNRALENLEKRIEKQSKVLEQFNDHHKKTLKETAEREYQRGLEAARERVKQAVEEGDVEGAEAAMLDAERLLKEGPATEKGEKKADNQEKPDEDAMQEVKKVREAWMSENDWYKTDRTMRKYAYECAEMLSKTEPDLTAKQQLDAVRDMVEEHFPDFFTNPNRKKANAVEGGGGRKGPASGGRKKTYNDLPAEAKALCDGFVSEIKGYKVQDYVDQYFRQ
jgi:hypothetical protein